MPISARDIDHLSLALLEPQTAALRLQELGFTYSDARSTLDRFREHDERMLQESFRYQRDEKKLIEIAERARRELESLFARDAAEERRSA